MEKGRKPFKVAKVEKTLALLIFIFSLAYMAGKWRALGYLEQDDWILLLGIQLPICLGIFATKTEEGEVT